MDWGALLASTLTGLAPVLPPFAAIAAFLLVLRCPLPGRGPHRSQGQDPWRGFKYESRRIVMERAGHRCEGAVFLAWGRCNEPAVEADHIYPWSRGGPTIVSNGQALCRGHNRNKGAMNPPWWYVLTLERRRRSYFPEGADVRVTASMTAHEVRARTK
ncbi:MAG: HNH endonuclease signature motif containing protein, partial [Propionicimonas sp.]|nr:HNH endonuclease signature motif containing protein [Propionicimonas sp.]